MNLYVGIYLIISLFILLCSIRINKESIPRYGLTVRDALGIYFCPFLWLFIVILIIGHVLLEALSIKVFPFIKSHYLLLSVFISFVLDIKIVKSQKEREESRPFQVESDVEVEE